MRLLPVAVCGLVGVLARYLLDTLLSVSDPGKFSFPWVTLGINLTGSFLAGLLYGLSLERTVIPAEIRVPLMAGFLGGFTTFSAFSIQCVNLWQSGRPEAAVAYGALSPALGVACAIAGVWVSRAIA